MADKMKIGASLVLDGEADFKKAISEITTDMTVLSSEMKKSTAQFADNANSMEALTARSDILNKQLNDQTLKVNVLRSALDAAKSEYGENSNQAQQWQIKLNNAEAVLAKTESQLRQTTSQMNNFGKETEVATEKSSLLSKIFAGGFLANIASNALSSLVSKLKQFVSAAFSSADELEKLKDVTGLTTDELQKMAYIGDELNVSVDVQTGAMKKLINNMSAAKKGTGDAYAAFQMLGISVVDSNGELLDSNVIYGKVIDALGKMTNETERDAAAQDIFGKSATELNPLIKAGSAALEELGNKAEAAGVVMSEDAVSALDATGDAIDHLKQTATAFVGETLAGFIGDGKTAAETMSGLADSITKTENIQQLIDNYERLNSEIGDSSLTSAELEKKTAELEDAKQALIDASGGVVTAFNKENGTFDKQVELLEGATKAEKEYVKYKLATIAIENTGVAAQIKSEEAAKKYADTQKLLNESLERQAKAEASIAANGSNIWNESQLKNATQSVGYFQVELGKASAGMTEVANAAASGESAIRQLADMGITAEQAYSQFGISIDTYNAALGAMPEATAEAIPVISEMKAAIDGLNAEYQAAYDSALESLNGQVGLWDSMKETTAKSVEDVNAALESQIEYFTNYRENLDALASRQIPGVDTSAMIQSLSDGTAESAAILAGLATATDDEIAKVAQNLKLSESAKDSLASDMAKVKVNYDKRWEEIVDSTAEAVKNLDKSDDARQSGINTLQGYINGVNSKSAALNLTMSNAAQAAMTAWKNQLGERSPAREFIKSGENAIKGDIIGIENMQGELNRTYSESARAALAAFQGESFSQKINGAVQQMNYQIRPQSQAGSAPVIGKMLEGAVNGMASIMGGSGGGGTYILQTILDGKVIAESVFDPLKAIAVQKGTA